MWGGRRANPLKPFRSLFHVSCLNLKTRSDGEHLASNHMKSWLEKLLRCQSEGNSRDGVMCECCLCGNSRLQCTVELNFIESGKKQIISASFSCNSRGYFFADICAASLAEVKHQEILPNGCYRGRWQGIVISATSLGLELD